MDECVLKCFEKVQNKNIPLCGILVHAKVKQFAVSLGNNNFKASFEWLRGFNERNEIFFKSVYGESSSVDEDAAK